MPVIPGVKQRKSGYFYYRRRIPDKLRPVFQKNEVIVSLKSRDRSVALSRGATLSQTVTAIFEEVMSTIEGISHERAHCIAENWKRRELNADFERRIAGAIKDSRNSDIDQQITSKALTLKQANYKPDEHWLSELIQDIDGNITPETQDWKRMAHYLLRAEIERLQEVKERDQAIIPTQLKYYEVSPETDAVSPGTNSVPNPSNIRLSEALNGWKHATKREDRVCEHWRHVVKRFIELLGDKQVGTITPGDIRSFRDALGTLPSNHQHPLRKKTLPDIKRESPKAGVPTVSTKTINHALSAMSAIFGWCIENGHLETNPARGIKKAATKGAKSKRTPFSPNDLNLIICEKILKAPEIIHNRSMGAAIKWIPILGLYTGARVEEIACLYPADIKEQNGILYIDIYADHQKRLKTARSERRVPLHPDLIKLGFLRYVKQMKATQKEWLFPALKLCKGRRSHYFSRWFGTFLRETCEITDTRKVFHSFRHTFKDIGREAGLDSKLNDALTGHADSSVSGGYGKGYSLKALNEGIRKMEFGLDLRKFT